MMSHGYVSSEDNIYVVKFCVFEDKYVENNWFLSAKIGQRLEDSTERAMKAVPGDKLVALSEKF